MHTSAFGDHGVVIDAHDREGPFRLRAALALCHARGHIQPRTGGAVSNPEGFFQAAATAARTIGRRAVLVAGETAANLTDLASADTLICRYTPYSLLFPCSAAVIHHGGVGTTGPRRCAADARSNDNPSHATVNGSGWKVGAI